MHNSLNYVKKLREPKTTCESQSSKSIDLCYKPFNKKESNKKNRCRIMEFWRQTLADPGHLGS